MGNTTISQQCFCCHRLEEKINEILTKKSEKTKAIGKYDITYLQEECANATIITIKTDPDGIYFPYYF